MPIDLENLPEDAAALRELVTNAELENAGLRAEIDKLHIMIKGFQRHRFGKRSKQLDAEQMQLVIEDIEQAMGAGAAAGDALAGAEAKNGRPRSPRPVRRQRNLGHLPASLPRFEVVIDLETKTCPCCRGELHSVGESPAEMLDIVPAQLRVKVIRRIRYTCQACDTPVTQAPAPPRPIDGGMATEALIACADQQIRPPAAAVSAGADILAPGYRARSLHPRRLDWPRLLAAAPGL